MVSRFTEEDVNKYRKFKKVDGATYRKVNAFLRKRTYITAREWAISRLCTDFRTRNGAEMTFIGQNLPRLVPFMEGEYTPQAVNQARNSFKKKVRVSGATFFYGAMCGFFTQEELDDLLFEASEVARFLLEVERTSLDIDEEIEIEDRITEIMRSVGRAAARILQERQEGTYPDDEEDRMEERRGDIDAGETRGETSGGEGGIPETGNTPLTKHAGPPHDPGNARGGKEESRGETTGSTCVQEETTTPVSADREDPSAGCNAQDSDTANGGAAKTRQKSEKQNMARGEE